MAGLTTAEAQATLDQRFPLAGATDHIAYSTNGASETAILARTPIGAAGWAAATAADPSVKANNSVLTSAGATGAGTVSHFAIYSTGGAQRTDWTALTASRTVSNGDKLEWAVGVCQVTLT